MQNQPTGNGARPADAGATHESPALECTRTVRHLPCSGCPACDAANGLGVHDSDVESSVNSDGAASDAVWVKCGRCKRRSKLESAFTPRRGLMRKRLCPLCQAGAKRGVTYWILTSIVSVFLWGVLFWMMYMRKYFGVVIFLTPLLDLLLLWILIWIHESLHCLAARICGARVFELRIGSGGQLFSKRFLGMRWTLSRRVLNGGLCLFVFTNLKKRWPLAVALGTPLAFHFLCGSALVPIFERIGVGRSIGEAVLIHFLWLNAYLFLCNLFYGDVVTQYGVTHCDGKQIWKLATNKNAVEEYRNKAHLATCYLASAEGESELAASSADALLAIDSDDPDHLERVVGALYFTKRYDELAGFAANVSRTTEPWTEEQRGAVLLGRIPIVVEPRLARATALLRAKRVDESIGLFEEIKAENVEPAVRGLTQMFHAHALLVFGAPLADASQALALAQESVDLLPWVGPCHGTHGAALIETGRDAEGLAALTRADALDVHPHNMALRNGYRALVAARAKNAGSTKKHLARARQHETDLDWWIGDMQARCEELLQSSLDS